MCGIIGYVGSGEAPAHLLQGLCALEYRGYDSAGVAVFSPQGRVESVKAKGKLDQLREKLKTHPLPAGQCGIGHTRWATHGAPEDQNAHPHTVGAVTLVHNGIIENEAELRATLGDAPYLSETDTEVAARLIDACYCACGDPGEALFSAAARLRGSYAFAVLFADHPGRIYAIRRDSPLILAKAADGAVLASDIPAILPHTRTYLRLPQDTVAVLTSDGITCRDREGNLLTLPGETVSFDVEQARKGGYAHFMRKEIAEQPAALHRTLSGRVRDGLPCFGVAELDTLRILRYRTVHLVACGTAMHACLVGKRLIERLARIPAQVEIASEFRYRDPILDPEHDLCLLLSQSGETADTLAALRHAKAAGVRTLAIVNVVGSSVAREADDVLYTPAGPEIAVASTKAYTVQCALLSLLALRLAWAHGRMGEEETRASVSLLLDEMPAAVEAALALEKPLADVAAAIAPEEHLFFIGRGIDADLCAEGSLKLKEISYLHSEAYPAGELKHGTISLIVEGTPVLALMTDPALCEKTLSAIREVAARGARVLCLAAEEIATRLRPPCHTLIPLPNTHPLIAPFPAVTALQLLAYHTATARGCDVDRPRNLAKSVTVE